MARRVLSNIVCGGDTDGFTLCISDEGNIYSFGTHSRGALSHPDPIVPLPTLIPSLKFIKSISCGLFHTVCLNADGEVFTFGSNEFGQLGCGSLTTTIEKSYEPIKLNIVPIQQISTGGNSSFCLSEDGDIFSFGCNTFGALGHGDTVHYNYPQKIESIKDKNINFISSGDAYTYCVLSNGFVYGWGLNDDGQLGIGNKLNQTLPIICKNWPTDIVDIKCGYQHTLVLTSIQEVYSCGSNFDNQLGRITNGDYSAKLEKIKELSEITRIECGYNHSMCIDNYNNFYIFGSNYFGQLGLGDDENKQGIIKHPSLSDVIDISTGGFHTFVKTSSNKIYAFGYNEESQLGVPTNKKKQVQPIEIFQNLHHIWSSSINRKSRAKSARK